MQTFDLSTGEHKVVLARGFQTNYGYGNGFDLLQCANGDTVVVSGDYQVPVQLVDLNTGEVTKIPLSEGCPAVGHGHSLLLCPHGRAPRVLRRRVEGEEEDMQG